MGLKTFVKINGVNNLSDARYCAGMGVDLIGFDAARVTTETFEEITGWVSGVGFVVEADDNIDTSQYKADYVEVFDHSLVAKITGKKVILSTPIDQIPKDLDNIEYLIITGSGEINANMIEHIKEIAKTTKVLISFGITADNVTQLLEDTQAFGIAISAGDEIRPGYKDYDELADILEELEIDEWA